MTRSNVKKTNISAIMMIISSICLMIFASVKLLIYFESLESDIVFILIFCMGVIVLLTGILIKLRYKIQTNKRIIARFINNIIAQETEQWYKLDILFITCIISGVILFLTLWMIFIWRMSFLKIVIFLIYIIPMCSALFYVALKRKGWKFKENDAYSFDELVSMILRLFNDNKIKFKEAKSNKVYLIAKSCKTFSLNNGELLLSILDQGHRRLIGLGKINSQNINLAQRIQKLIDINA